MAKFEIKKIIFFVYIFFLLYKTNRFHVAVRLFSNRSQQTSKCGKNISDTRGCVSCATFLFLPHFDVICDLMIYDLMHSTGQEFQLPRGKGHERTSRSYKKVPHLTSSLSLLSEKTRKTHHLQMILQRQHILLSYLNTLSAGPVGVSNSRPLAS